MVEAGSESIDRHKIGRKPFGNKISNAPLSQAVFKLAPTKGYFSQKELAEALGMKSNSLISRILRGEQDPSPEVFGRLLIALDPDEEELETLVVPYCEVLIRQEGKKPERFAKYIKPAANPVGKWIEQWCSKKRVPIKKFDELVDCRIGSNRKKFGFDLFYKFLQNASNALDLSETERRSLEKAVSREIRQRKKEHMPLLKKNRGYMVKKMQKEAGNGFTGEEAADKLGVSRETINYWAYKLGLPLLLREQDIQIIRVARSTRKSSIKERITERTGAQDGLENKEYVIFEQSRLAG